MTCIKTLMVFSKFYIFGLGSVNKMNNNCGVISQISGATCPGFHSYLVPKKRKLHLHKFEQNDY